MSLSKLFKPFIVNRCKKVKYKSSEVADSKISVINSKAGFSLTKSYYCHECEAWHLTSSKQL